MEDDITLLVRDLGQKSSANPDLAESRLGRILLNAAHLISLIFGLIQLSMEGGLNFLNANGGLFELLKNILLGKDIMEAPKSDSPKYLTLISYIDPRYKLYMDVNPSPDSPRFPDAAPESKITADVCMMASKLAYENSAVIESVVKNQWQMNFVGSYQYWNEYVKLKSTQLFIFTEKEENAKAIVVAFRGTECFDAYDWASDFNCDMTDIGGIGIHTGFLTALFTTAYHAGSEINTDENKKLLRQTIFSGDNSQPHAFSGVKDTLLSLLEKHPLAKIYITGHSLGGALAALFSTLLYFLQVDDLANRVHVVYTFGQPRVGDLNFAQFMRKRLHGRYFRVVYSNDVVARVGPDDSLLNFYFKHCPPAYYYNCSYMLSVRHEVPYKNIRDFPTVTITWIAVVELVMCLLRINRESCICFVTRLMGLALPVAIAHSPVNYINAIRDGPPKLAIR